MSLFCNHRRRLSVVAILTAFALTSCSTLERYNFLQPNRDWKTRTGQLQYKNIRTTIVGDVVTRISKRGDFELTFSKGPGLVMLTIQQNDHYAQVKGPLTQLGWSGPVERAPKQLRGWLSLREKLMQAQDRSSITETVGSETFTFRF